MMDYFSQAALGSVIASLYARTPGHDYRFRVRKMDNDANWCQWAYGRRFRVRAVQENDGAISYSSGDDQQDGSAWSRTTREGAYGKYVMTSTAGHNASATFAFYGRSVAVATPRRTYLGKARICLDPGTVRQSCSTLDLSPTDADLLGPRKLVWTRNGLNNSVRHRVTITTAAGRVDLDAIIVLR